MPIRSYPEMESIMRHIEALVHKYLPDYTVELVHPRSPPYVGMNLGRKKVIRLNPNLITQSPLEEIEDVVRHEIAHTFQYASVEHSKDWQNAARALGSSLLKSHGEVSYDSRQPRFRYRCVTCGLEFASSRIIPPNVAMRNQDEPSDHDFGHQDFYVMDLITRKKWKVSR